MNKPGKWLKAYLCREYNVKLIAFVPLSMFLYTCVQHQQILHILTHDIYISSKNVKLCHFYDFYGCDALTYWSPIFMSKYVDVCLFD